ncbi:arsenic-transporting ATPase [Alteribacter lacisalsi]|uniref:Arsenic-transporting ATPase n=1 Tax=Alteribacter lacisalsi TaxID=2045244 RepID=A0A2W0H785_9BACI|nr:ArsA family ATPase [Alteribacter lacisalsi]PYZ96596.1 arsenic-transporting ATPase [Alteribacter lacisalsi]
MHDLTRLKPVLFVGGKGGVGKSTTASALALSASRRGQRTLLISTDPAHNLGDLFHTRLSDEPVEVRSNLSVMELDPEKESERYIAQVKANIQGHVKATMIDEVHRQMDMAKSSPGADEAAMFDRIVSILLEERPKFDHVIFDTAPTGHTLRLMSLPEMMGVWMDGMLERRRKTNEDYTQLLNDGEPVDDPIFDTLQARREKFVKVREILLDKTVTGFLFVMNPERLPIEEARRGVATLRRHDIPVEGVVVNKVIPSDVDGQFFVKRKAQQEQYLAQIDEAFAGLPQLRLPLLEEDISTTDHLDRMAEVLDQAVVMD